MIKRTVIFILDGGPMPPGARCSFGPMPVKLTGSVTLQGSCPERSAGTYEVVDAETNHCYGAVQLCKIHGQQFATGGSA